MTLHCKLTQKIQTNTGRKLGERVDLGFCATHTHKKKQKKRSVVDQIMMYSIIMTRELQWNMKGMINVREWRPWMTELLTDPLRILNAVKPECREFGPQPQQGPSGPPAVTHLSVATFVLPSRLIVGDQV